MKHLKKLACLLLVLALAFSLSVTATAAQEGTLEGGTITINKAEPGETYNAYQILYLESYDESRGAYAYKVNSAWESFIKAEASEYLSVDAQGYVTWIMKDEKGENTGMEDFAKLAQLQAATKTPDATATASGSSVVFEGLKLGYYLVDTSLGSLCALDTTNPAATVNEKNEKPTLDKEVKEDDAAEGTDPWGVQNTAQIGDTVEFRTTVHAKKGAVNYVLHDKMTEGLTLDESSIQVMAGEKELTAGTDYTVTYNVEHEKDDGTVDYVCDFEIAFAEAYLDTIEVSTDIVVTYNAVLNDKAVVFDGVNLNDTGLTFGDSGETEWDQTETYAFRFDIVKTDAALKVLDGAEFELYDAETAGNKLPLVEVEDGKYRVATGEEQKAEGFVSAVIKAGKATVEGLDANTSYWLQETKAPAGYNILAKRVEVKIEEANLTTTMDGDVWETGDGGVQITNQTGTELPETGGMGTTLFYVVGGLLVVGAAVLLITRRRMSREV